MKKESEEERKWQRYRGTKAEACYNVVSLAKEDKRGYTHLDFGMI
jgi:hypothetical protein